MIKKLKPSMTLKQIAFALLDKYKESKTGIIWEYSSNIPKELGELDEFYEDCYKLIDSKESLN